MCLNENGENRGKLYCMFLLVIFFSPFLLLYQEESEWNRIINEKFPFPSLCIHKYQQNLSHIKSLPIMLAKYYRIKSFCLKWRSFWSFLVLEATNLYMSFLIHDFSKIMLLLWKFHPSYIWWRIMSPDCNFWFSKYITYEMRKNFG